MATSQKAMSQIYPEMGHFSLWCYYCDSPNLPLPFPRDIVELYFSTSRKLGATMWAISLGNKKKEVMCDILSFKSQCVFWSHSFPTQWCGFCWSELSSGFGWTELPWQYMLDIMSKKYTFIMWDLGVIIAAKPSLSQLIHSPFLELKIINV